MTKIYEAKDHILIHTGYDDPTEHHHMAAHIIVSLGTDLNVISDQKTYVCRGIRIPSGVSHRIETKGNSVLVFLYDCTTDVARAIRNTEMIEEPCCNRIISNYHAFDTGSGYDALDGCIREQLRIQERESRLSDERILHAMQHIQNRISDSITCREIAAAVCLSESRFSHLFRQQVGMTFASYLIYQRIIRVYTAILQNRSITEAALEAGFCSSSHFADVNRRIFGLSAGEIIKNAVFIKIQ